MHSFYSHLGMLLASCMIWSLAVHDGFAQSSELTSQDNHALLYAHQLGFTSEGTPTVRMRITDGIQKLRFIPNGDFYVMPAENDGISIRLKGHQTYEVTISHSTLGTNQYGVILSRNTSSDALKSEQTAYREAHIATEIVPVGTVFALRGHVFDNRENLLMTPRLQNRRDVESQWTQTPEWRRHDDSPEIYQERVTYPTARITLRDERGNIQIEQQNLLWMDFANTGAKLLDIVDESGKISPLEIDAKIIVTPDDDGQLAVVQSADIETLLRGIVPAEIFASAPEAALMAQAIAARTTLIAQAGSRHTTAPYHLCNRQHCQVYRGLSGADPRTDKAIEKTRGKVMFYDKTLVQSYYSAHCGGFSSGSDETWGLPDKPYLVSRSDDVDEVVPHFENDEAFMTWWSEPALNYCATAPKGKKAFTSTKHARWSVHYTLSELDDFVQKSGRDIGKIQNIEILERGKSYRVTKMKVSGSKGEIMLERELPIRRFFGNLKSALFAMTLEKKGHRVSGIQIYGAGFGHGVGLCQTGAIGMAQRGISENDILLHYFPGIHIDTLW